MNAITIARTAKVCALLGFFMPWALVSCSGQTVASMSGFALATGNVPFKGVLSGAGQQPSANMFLVLALLAIAGGLAASFAPDWAKRGKNAAMALLVGAIAAIVLSLIAIMTLYAARDEAIQKAGANNQMAGGAAGLVEVHTQFGLWFTLAALAAAAGAAGLVIADRESLLDTVGAEARRIAGQATTGGKDDDERFWDRMANKSDPELLEEYVHRYPNGRFASLARARLTRAGVASPSPTPTPTGNGQPEHVYVEAPPSAAASPGPASEHDSAPAMAALVKCSVCGANAIAGARFCTKCGTALQI